LATHSIRQFPFTSTAVCHHVPSHFNWSLPCSSTPFAVIATILILLTEIFVTNWFHFLFKCIHIALYMVLCFFRQFTIMCIQQISFSYLRGPFNFSYIYSLLSWLECDIMCSLHKTFAVLVLPLYQKTLLIHRHWGLQYNSCNHTHSLEL
jgi:hypothetical protein